MARIPTPGFSGAPQVGSVGLQQEVNTPNQSFNVPDFAGQARALQQAGNSISSVSGALTTIAEEIKREEDDASLLEIQTAYGQWEQDYLLDPENGLYSRQGGNTRGSFAQAQKDFQAWREQSATEEMSDDARITVDRWLNARFNAEAGTIANHERNQMNEYNIELLQTSMTQEVSSAASRYTSPEALQRSETLIRQQAAEISRRQGHSSERAEAYVQNQVAAIYDASIRRAVADGADGHAKNLLEELERREELGENDPARLTIDAEAMATLKTMVEDTSIAREVYRQSDDIMVKYSGNQSGALAAARDIDDPIIRAGVVSNINARFTEQQVIRNRANEQRFNNASNAAAAGQPVTEDMLSNLDARERAYIRNLEQEARFEAANPNYNRPGDGGVTFERYMANFDENAAWLQDITLQNLRSEYHMGVTETQWQGIVAEWRGAQINQDSAAREIASAEAASLSSAQEAITSISPDEASIFRSMLRGAGLDSTEATSTNSEQYDMLLQNFRSRLNDYRLSNNGREPDRQQRLQILQSTASETIQFQDLRGAGPSNRPAPASTDPEDFRPAALFTEENIRDLADNMDINEDVMSSTWSPMLSGLRATGRAVTSSNIEWIYGRAQVAAPGNEGSFFGTYPQISNFFTANGIFNPTDQDWIDAYTYFRDQD
jgi:hypothetical protein